MPGSSAEGVVNCEMEIHYFLTAGLNISPGSVDQGLPLGLLLVDSDKS